MLRFASVALFLAAATAAAQAHFVFVIPDAKDPGKATVVFSDDLGVDDAVTMDKISGLKLQVRDAGGKATDAKLEVGKHSIAAAVPGTGPRVVFGSVNYGVMQKGDAKPYLLAYHPKAVVGEVPADGGKVGGAAPELVPVAAGSKVKFLFLVAGKPTADAEVTVMLPDGKKEKVKTDSQGLTQEFAGAGRYGAWTRTTEAKGGEHGGKKYEEERHYATLVVDVAAK
ncbi:DUF4198 domain-containing protein [Gemmata sp.]|uniref:DUF4198 domain-containing protein n=1 Tax=Gemmata sp. TaxID=1914242 RepID=UPI003F6EB3FF